MSPSDWLLRLLSCRVRWEKVEVAQIAGNMARLPSSVLNTAAIAYLGFRTAFVLLYVNGTTSERFTVSRLFLDFQVELTHCAEALANARFASWLGASFTCLSLFVRAGNKFRQGLGNLAL